MLQGECVGGSLICTVWHPDATLAELQAAWKGPIAEIQAETVEDAKGRIPESWRQRLESSSTINLPPVVLLKTPRPVLESLREQGFHAGHWRDWSTGYDRGLAEVFDAATPEHQRPTKLAAWFD